MCVVYNFAFHITLVGDTRVYFYSKPGAKAPGYKHVIPTGLVSLSGYHLTENLEICQVP